MIARASAGKRSSAAARLYLFYVQLAEIEPPIWRRLAVPGARTLHALHGILQAVMPWQDYHLYQFEIGDTRYEDPNPDDRDPSVPDPRAVTLDQLDFVQGSQFQYTYDFGDDWLHDLTVEGVVPLPRDFLLPVCLGGARACPPEDCGGVGGYEELIAALRRPKSAAAREYKEWLGRVYDPEELDLAAIMCASVIEPRVAVRPVLASSGAALSNLRMQPTGRRGAGLRPGGTCRKRR